VGASVGGGVGASVGGGVTSGVAVGSMVGLGMVDAGGQGRAATSEPVGVGRLNDGITPLASGVGSGMHDGEGLGDGPQPLPLTRAPHVRPYGWKAPL
jgi:hypothetical protein